MATSVPCQGSTVARNFRPSLSLPRWTSLAPFLGASPGAPGRGRTSDKMGAPAIAGDPERRSRPVARPEDGRESVAVEVDRPRSRGGPGPRPIAIDRHRPDFGSAPGVEDDQVGRLLVEGRRPGRGAEDRRDEEFELLLEGDRVRARSTGAEDRAPAEPVDARELAAVGGDGLRADPARRSCPRPANPPPAPMDAVGRRTIGLNVHGSSGFAPWMASRSLPRFGSFIAKS